MKHKLIEQSVLFASLLKWFLIASLIGTIVGASTSGFLWLLNYSTTNLQHWPYYYFLLPVAMFTSICLIRYLCPEAEGHGTEQVIKRFIKNRGG
jgi:H+/Cl- antiporter ClcA